MIIYKITNKINGKVYIGQTTGSIETRWKAHCKGNSRCSAILLAIRKYGKENFKIEEIGGANNLSELNYQEWLLIHKNNSLAPNGYNLREGGRSRRQSRLIRDKIGKSNGVEIIDCSTGKMYFSSCEASRDLKTQQSHISSCVNGKLNSHLGRVFVKASSWDGVLIPVKPRYKMVVEVLSGEIYSSAREVSEKLNIELSGVKGVLCPSKPHSKTYRGYTFKYVDEISNV